MTNMLEKLYLHPRTQISWDLKCKIFLLSATKIWSSSLSSEDLLSKSYKNFMKILKRFFWKFDIFWKLFKRSSVHLKKKKLLILFKINKLKQRTEDLAKISNRFFLKKINSAFLRIFRRKDFNTNTLSRKSAKIFWRMISHEDFYLIS